MKAAQQRAGEITTAAQNEARTLRQTVTDYCDNMLKNTEETMVENAAQVKNVRANLRQNAKKKRLKTAFFTHKLHIRQKPKVPAGRNDGRQGLFLLHFADKNGSNKPLQSGA